MTLIVEACSLSGMRDRNTSAQQPLRPPDSHQRRIRTRRHANGTAKESNEVKRRQPDVTRH
ncbi:MAG TPA: hypothetical protein VFB85_22175, partial [Vicinamibacterales bacterium]|nr:hypothetical protein [Vicinamibacterales bacterium]